MINHTPASAIINQTFEFIGVLNLDGTLLEANQSALDDLGIQLEQVQGRPFWQSPWWTHAPEQQQQLQSAIAKARAGQLVRCEVTYPSANGRVERFDFSIKPVLSEAGQVISLLVKGQNIADRQPREQQPQVACEALERRVAERTHELAQSNRHLQESEARLQRLAANAPGMIYQYILHPDGSDALTYVSPRCRDIYEVEPEELLRDFGQVWAMIHPEDVERVHQVNYHSAQQLERFDIEFRLLPPSGCLKWILVISQPERQANGDVIWDGFVLDISDRKQMEIELQQSEEKFRHFAENSHAVIWIAQPTSLNNVYVSPAYETIWGRSRQSLLDRPDSWLEAIHPDDCDRVRAKLEPQCQGEFSDIEYRIVRPDGSVRWIWDWGFPIRDESGQIYHFGGIAEDITERKQSELQLREMSAALSNAVEGISRLDQQGRYISVNEAYASMVGYAPAEMIGMDWQRTVHPDDLESVIAEYQHMLKTGKVELETRGIRKDGSVFDKQLFMISAYDEQQRFIGHHCFMKDISERKRLEVERRAAEQKIREQATLIDAASDAIYACNLSNGIIFWNQGAERLYGWQRQEALGENSLKLLFQAQLPELSPALAAVLETGEWQGEFQQVTKSGKAVTVMSRLTLIRDADGIPRSILTVNTDITEKKTLEAQFLRAQRLESIGTLASGIAHDLNNILTPILAAAQLLPLRMPPLDELNQRLLEILEINARRGSDLVKQVLSFARGTEEQRTSLQIGHLLSEIAKMAEQTFSKSITISTCIPTSELWLLKADPTQLHQVIMNLCINARDAMPKGGTLTITAENRILDESFARLHLKAQVGHYVMITISDTGTGIAPDVLERIFEPFFTTKEPGLGTGLGLSTVNTILKNHGGFVEVSSQVGIGTHFSIYLPASAQEEPQPLETTPALIGNGELILVVDDEPAIRETTQALLETYGYKVLTATDGIDGIARYAEHQQKIRAVLLDLMMPSFNGFSLISVLPKMNPQVNLVAMSGLKSNEAIAREKSNRVQAFLAKPFTTQELLHTLQQVLAGASR